MAVLGYLPKLKRDLRLAFSAHFLHSFSIKMFLILSNQNLPCKYERNKILKIIKSYKIYLKNEAFRDKSHHQVIYK